MAMNVKQLRNTLLLVLTALIWGCSFVAQSVGADHGGRLLFWPRAAGWAELSFFR